MGSEGRPRRAALAVLLISLLFAGCDRSAPPAAQPTPLVVVCHPLDHELIDWDTYTGTLEAPSYIKVLPRVNGEMVDAPFIEGSIVEKGATLFSIDVSPFKADLDAKEASVRQAEAQAGLAELNFKRAAELRPSNAVSQQDYDTADQASRQAKAVVAGAKAARDLSAKNVEWCTVVAPVKGRVSNKLVTPGNQVTTTTLLTTVASVDTIYCYVNVDEQSVLKYQRLREEKKRVSARDAQIPCFMRLMDETTFPHEGVVDFVDNHVDPKTGTLRCRGIFPNPGGTLQTGFYATVRVPGSGRFRSLLVPEIAIGTDQSDKFVLIVGADKKVVKRKVILGILSGNLRSIESGVEASDWVIYKGVQLARPGTVVDVKEQPIDPEAFNFKLTAPGSAATQALPATRNLPPTGATTAPATQAGPAGGAR